MDDFDLFKSDEGLGAAVLTQRSLVDTQERLGAMLDVMPIGLLIHTEQGILFANRAGSDLLGADTKRLTGQHILDFLRAADVAEMQARLTATFAGKQEMFEYETMLEVRGRSPRLVKIISSRLPWPGNPVVQVLVQDITDQKRAEDSLRHLSITDELTGAYNRRHAFYEAALHIDDRNRAPLSVVMLDIDHFKAVNDTHGHAAGDVALKQLTALACELLPTLKGGESAMFARMGGEEFVMLLPGLDLTAAVEAAERIRKAVEAMPIELASGTLRLTVSAGVAELMPRDADFGGLLVRADQALYEAKGAGRNRVMVAKGSGRVRRISAA